MRNTFAIVTALCVGSALVGCNSKSNPSQPGTKAPTIAQPGPAVNDKGSNTSPVVVTPPGPVPVTNPSWTLKLQSKCGEAIEGSQCLGFYGFSVDKSGEYLVGPDAKGMTRKGALTDEEKSVIDKALSSTLAQSNVRAESHETLEQPAESEDTVTLSKTNGSSINIARANGSDLFFQTQNGEEAKTLLTAIRNLADKYAKNFPDACIDGTSALQDLIASNQKCSADSDCVYLDNAMEIVAPNSSEVLTVDDCSKVTPVYIGNAESIRVNKDKIATDLDAVRGACGDNIIKEGCFNVTTFELKGKAATCQQGVCKLPTQ